MPQTLTYSPAQVIARLLIDLGLGSDPETAGAWPVSSSGEPAAPDNCITVYNTQGTDGGRAMVTGELLGNYGFQVRVRAKDTETGWTKADAIQTALAESVYQETVHVGARTYLVHAVSRIGDVFEIGKEVPTSKRSVFTINATVTLEEVN